MLVAGVVAIGAVTLEAAEEGREDLLALVSEGAMGCVVLFILNWWGTGKASHTNIHQQLHLQMM